MLAVTIGTENLTNGMGSAAFVAYLSGLCNTAFTATQYALLSSLATVGVNILSASGGWLADELGWVAFFLVSLAMTVPGLVLLIVIRRDGRLRPPAQKRSDAVPATAGTG
jgi:PAT family beta-lactamase induction signal transducer AmpG